MIKISAIALIALSILATSIGRTHPADELGNWRTALRPLHRERDLLVGVMLIVFQLLVQASKGRKTFSQHEGNSREEQTSSQR